MPGLKQKTRRHVNTIVCYGIGGTTCSGRYPREAIEGLTARQLLGRVADTPQSPGPSARTAAVLREALLCSREIDVELARQAYTRGVHQGTPILLTDVVVPKTAGNPERQETVNDETVTLLVSESYRGGQL